MIKGCAVFRPTKATTLEHLMQLVTSAIVAAREQQFRKLMVVITGLSNLKLPSLTDRYIIIRKWADAAQGQVSLAFVARPEWIDREHIGATIAENAGLRGRSFALEEEAIAWLQNVDEAAPTVLNSWCAGPANMHH